MSSKRCIPTKAILKDPKLRIKTYIAWRKSTANASHYNLTKNRNVIRKYKKTHTVLIKLAERVKILGIYRLKYCRECSLL